VLLDRERRDIDGVDAGERKEAGCCDLVGCLDRRCGERNVDHRTLEDPARHRCRDPPPLRAAWNVRRLVGRLQRERSPRSRAAASRSCSIASSSSSHHSKWETIGAPRDVAQPQFERETASQHPLAGRVRDEALEQALQDDPFAKARHARRVALPVLDPSLERGAKCLVGRVLHRVSSAIFRCTVFGTPRRSIAAGVGREFASERLGDRGLDLLGEAGGAQDVDNRAVNSRHRHPKDLAALPLRDGERCGVDHDAVESACAAVRDAP
jgi:hypothetical protein